MNRKGHAWLSRSSRGRSPVTSTPRRRSGSGGRRRHDEERRVGAECGDGRKCGAMTYGCTVLLSGGMDSVSAALGLALAITTSTPSSSTTVRANRDRRDRRGRASGTERWRCPSSSTLLEAVRGHQPLKPAPMAPHRRAYRSRSCPRGTRSSSCAAAHAAKRYGGQRVHLRGRLQQDRRRAPDQAALTS